MTTEATVDDELMPSVWFRKLEQEDPRREVVYIGEPERAKASGELMCDNLGRRLASRTTPDIENRHHVLARDTGSVGVLGSANEKAEAIELPLHRVRKIFASWWKQTVVKLLQLYLAKHVEVMPIS